MGTIYIKHALGRKYNLWRYRIWQLYVFFFQEENIETVLKYKTMYLEGFFSIISL